MKKIIILIFSISGLLLVFTDCHTRKISSNKLPDIKVENEEVVYEYSEPNNGSGPFWCLGNSILARNDEDLYLSGTETLKQYKPANNLRWILYKRDPEGWKLQQADEKGRTREPCPIGLFSDGRLMMSVHPTLDTALEKTSTVNQPQILEFSTVNLKGAYNTMLPQWVGSPVFTEHTYRTFSIDRENNEFILFNSSRGLSHKEWTYLDRNGKWWAGQLKLLPYVDDSITPFNEKYMAVTYPSVVLKNREVHCCGNVAINKWSKIQNQEDAKRYGIEDIKGYGGRIAGMRFRRIYYTWTPDITKEGFSPFLEIANSYENGESLRVLDMWLDPEGIVHVIWHQHPIYKDVRDKYFPDIKRVWSINYVRIKNGEIILKKVLLETGDGVAKTMYNDLLNDYMISFCRFHVSTDNRLFVIFHISGTDDAGSAKSENRLMEIFRDGSTSMSVPVPLKYPMSLFFTATPRGGSITSDIIDMVGQASGDRYKVRYAKIKLSVNY